MKASGALSGAAAIAVAWFGIQFGARAAGGADAQGYLSQGYLWLQGDVRIEETVSRVANWPFAAESVSPLGYRPGPDRGTIVPTYAPGTPWLMALAIRMSGHCGPFYVAPILGGMLVLATWMLARRLGADAFASAVAAILMATSPTLLLNVPLPMSDTAAAALWVVSLVLLTIPGLAAAISAGVTAGMAVAVRPNLAPLLLAGLLAATFWNDRPWRVGRLAGFLGGGILGPIGVAIVNSSLYGSPWQSGYSGLEFMFRLQNVEGNLYRYAMWLGESQSVLVALGIVPLVVRASRPQGLTVARALPLALYLVIIALVYLFYLQFDSWLFLRFFLPALPLLFISMGLGVAWIARLRPAIVFMPLALVLLCLSLLHTLPFAYRQGASQVGPGEQRFAAVADFVNRALPGNAALIGRQHTGSLAFYTGQLVLRFDFLPKQRLQSVVDWLEQHGYRPYVVLEDWEEAAFRSYFAAGTDRVSRLDIAMVAQTSDGIRVRVYDPLRAADSSSHVASIPILGAPECAAPAASWP